MNPNIHSTNGATPPTRGLGVAEADDSPMPLVKAPLKPAQEHCQPQAHPLSLLGRMSLQPSLGLLHGLPRPLLNPANFFGSYTSWVARVCFTHCPSNICLAYCLAQEGEENQRLGMLHWSQRRRRPAGKPGKNMRTLSDPYHQRHILQFPSGRHLLGGS